jgi:hypothetical protein
MLVHGRGQACGARKPGFVLRAATTYHQPMPSVLSLLVRALVRLLVLPCLGDGAKDLEILVLRQQLRVLRRKTGRPTFTAPDRTLLAAASRAHGVPEVDGARDQRVWLGVELRCVVACSPSLRGAAGLAIRLLGAAPRACCAASPPSAAPTAIQSPSPACGRRAASHRRRRGRRRGRPRGSRRRGAPVGRRPVLLPRLTPSAEVKGRSWEGYGHSPMSSLEERCVPANSATGK